MTEKRVSTEFLHRLIEERYDRQIPLPLLTAFVKGRAKSPSSEIAELLCRALDEAPDFRPPAKRFHTVKNASSATIRLSLKPKEPDNSPKKPTIHELEALERVTVTQNMRDEFCFELERLQAAHSILRYIEQNMPGEALKTNQLYALRSGALKTVKRDQWETLIAFLKSLTPIDYLRSDGPPPGSG